MPYFYCAPELTGSKETLKTLERITTLIYLPHVVAFLREFLL